MGTMPIYWRFLKKNGFDLPTDYFDLVDEGGNYKGKRLKIEDFKRKGNPNNAVEKLENPQDGPINNLIINGKTVRYIRLKAIVHQNAMGEGWLSSKVDEYIDEANRIFRLNGVPIIFYSLCNDITYVFNSPNYDINGRLQAYNMFFTNYNWTGDAIEMHFVNSAIIDGTGSGGMVYAIGSTELFVTKNSYVTTLAHELGHCLGLSHTHNPKLPCDAEGNEDCADCWQEPVSRTRTQPFWCYDNNTGKKKCNINGDALCDTPGEPILSGHVTFNCTIDWNSNIDNTDNWNTQWTPMMFNVMSYSRCRDLFSAGQIGIMLDNLPYFATTTDQYSISGPTSMCVGSSATYSIPSLQGVGSYAWSVPSGAHIVSGQGSNTITVYFQGVFGGQPITVQPNCGFPRSELTVGSLSGLNIFGDSRVSTNQFVYYFTDNIVDANYSWSVPYGWGYNTGDGTSGISLISQSYIGNAFLSVSASTPHCTLYGEKVIEVNDGVILYLKNADDFKRTSQNASSISVYDPKTASFIKESTDIIATWANLDLGFYIIRFTYGDKVQTVKVIKTQKN